MTLATLAMLAAVFSASLLQAATGIGYGVIAGPIMLIALNGGEALQISIIHNLAIALVLAPGIRQQADRAMLKTLIVSAIFGLPLGFAIFTYASLPAIKMFAAIVVIFTLMFSLFGSWRNRNRQTQQDANSVQSYLAGGISGILGGALAMPGPIAAAWMALAGWKKTTVRATILVYFVVAYGSALALQLAFGEIGEETWWTSTIYLPLVAIGIFTGKKLVNVITEAQFRLILQTVLAGTALSLLFSL